jgi:hypothetical protein
MREGYVFMDHVEWVEANNRALRQIASRGRSKEAARILADVPEQLSEFQRRAVTIIGMAFGGIYNARVSWRTVEWQYGKGVAFMLNHETLSTFDASALTDLVFLCHAARVRLELEAAAAFKLRVAMHPRSDEGGLGARHPDLQEAVAAFDAMVPPEHPVRFRRKS